MLAGKESAGILLYRRKSGLEVLLAHPGGPFWANKDDGAWSIPKGEPDPDEELLDAAQREFLEETSFTSQPPFLDLGNVRQRSGKVVHAWASEGDVDASKAKSNLMKVIWPRSSGRWLTVPEVDRCEWFSPQVAARKLNPAQVEFVERLQRLLGE